jgi:amidase
MKRAALLILTLLVWCPALGAKTIDLDAATIADIDAAFKAGALTAERLVQLCLARIGSYAREGPSLHAVMRQPRRGVDDETLLSTASQ